MAPASRQQFADLHEAAEFALQCTDGPFKVFLHERKGMEFPLTDDNAVAAVLRLLGLRNRCEITTNESARAEWNAMRAEFQEWRLS